MIYMEAMTDKMTGSSPFTKYSQKRYNICSRTTASIIIASIDKRYIVPDYVIDAQSRQSGPILRHTYCHFPRPNAIPVSPLTGTNSWSTDMKHHAGQPLCKPNIAELRSFTSIPSMGLSVVKSILTPRDARVVNAPKCHPDSNTAEAQSTNTS